jgi:hypothetical protein
MEMEASDMKAMSWCEKQRIDWIAETLRIFGFIQRDHLRRKFGISTPQASLDLNKFMRLYPHTMAYQPKQKRYIAL